MDNQPKRDLRGEVGGLLVIAAAVFAFISLLGRGGAVGELLARCLEWAAGNTGARLLPVLAAVGGLLGFLPRLTRRGQRFAGLALATVVSMTLFHMRYPVGQELAYAERSMGGGMVGALIALGLQRGFGVAGRALILGVLGLASALMMSDLSLPEMLVRLFRTIRAAFGRVIRPLINLFYDDADESDGDEVAEGSSAGGGERPKIIDLASRARRRQAIVPDEDLPDGPADGLGGQAHTALPRGADTGGAGKKKTRPAATPTEAPKPTHQHYTLPPLDLLTAGARGKAAAGGQKDVSAKTKLIEDTLASFGVAAKVIDVQRGPTVTRFELQPAAGVKINRIVSLSDDLALNLAAQGVRIEAPIPGKAAIGIEVPNSEIAVVYLREALETREFEEPSSKLTVCLGKDIAGRPLIANLEKMIHLLIAGATGSGKSVCVNSIITSLLYKATPEEVKFLMIDPKMVELTTYNGIPHLIAPVVTDPKKAATALKWVVDQMQRRYELFVQAGVRDIGKYNAQIVEKNPQEKPLPYIVVILDELADLMMVAPVDVEDAIFRLAQMARAAGIHLIVATQRPSVDVITGVIKANIPSRIAFAVASQVDSRTILDANGAEKLLGRGDMLYSPVGSMKPIRAQGAFVADSEVEAIAGWCRDQAIPEYELGVLTEIADEAAAADDDGTGDSLFPQAVRIVVETGQASVSMLQRRLRVGYTRAGRLIDLMEERGYVGRHEGSKPRDVLITFDQFRRTFGGDQ